MAYAIKWSHRAASNFEDICNYIGKDFKYYASLFSKKVNAIIKTIPQFPNYVKKFLLVNLIIEPCGEIGDQA